MDAAFDDAMKEAEKHYKRQRIMNSVDWDGIATHFYTAATLGQAAKCKPCTDVMVAQVNALSKLFVYDVFFRRMSRFGEYANSMKRVPEACTAALTTYPRGDLLKKIVKDHDRKIVADLDVLKACVKAQMTMIDPDVKLTKTTVRECAEILGTVLDALAYAKACPQPSSRALKAVASLLLLLEDIGEEKS
jgi:hypothetical protein